MKNSIIFQSLTALSICAVAIACHAQEAQDTSVHHALFEELYDHEWFVEYREFHQRGTDMVLYGLVDLEALRPIVYTDGFDPCDPYATTDISKIRGADDYFNHVCDKGALHKKIMTRYPEVRDMSQEERIKLMYDSNELTTQEAEQLIDIRRRGKPD